MDLTFGGLPPSFEYQRSSLIDLDPPGQPPTTRCCAKWQLGSLIRIGMAVSIGGWLLSGSNGYALFGAMFLVGACSMPIYALCIATASDNTDMSMIQIGSGILIMHSAGSIIGPLIVAPLMTWQGGSAFFLYLAVCFSLAAVWAVYRIVLVDRPQTHEHTFESVPKTTPVILELSQETPLEDGVEAPGVQADEPNAPSDERDRVEGVSQDKP